MTAEETIDHLEGQLKDALERLKEMSERLRETEEHLQQAQARIAELEKQKTSPHRSLGQQEEGGRSGEEAAQKAAAQYNRGRHRAVPTQIVEHRIVTCPDCHLRLGGISLARCREVIDVPPPAKVEVSEHRIYKEWCTDCQ